MYNFITILSFSIFSPTRQTRQESGSRSRLSRFAESFWGFRFLALFSCFKKQTFQELTPFSINQTEAFASTLFDKCLCSNRAYFVIYILYFFFYFWQSASSISLFLYLHNVVWTVFWFDNLIKTKPIIFVFFISETELNNKTVKR